LKVIRLLQRCRSRGIQLNEKKFKFKEKEIVFAGLKLSEEGFTVDSKIVKAIQEFPTPTSITDVRSFYGLANQLSPYDHELAKKLEPLRHLLKSKNKVLELNDEEERAFRETKLRLASPQTLAYYIPGRPVRMFTDAACTRGFGFVLQQLQPDNTWKPIQLGSRALTDAETRYAPIEAEITAITWALRQARKFLIGVPRFNIYTDHRPLVSLINNKRLEEVENMRILRNLIKCQDFNMEVHYIKGSENVAADSLSRHPVDRPEPKDYKASDKAFRHMKAINRVSALQHELSLAEEEILEVGQIDAEYTSLRDQIQQGFPESKKDLEPSLHPYWQIRHDLHVADDDLVLYGTCLVIPKALRQKTIQ